MNSNSLSKLTIAGNTSYQQNSIVEMGKKRRKIVYVQMIWPDPSNLINTEHWTGQIHAIVVINEGETEMETVSTRHK